MAARDLLFFTTSHLHRQGPHLSFICFSCKWLEITNPEESGMGGRVGIINVLQR